MMHQIAPVETDMGGAGNCRHGGEDALPCIVIVMHCDACIVIHGDSDALSCKHMHFRFWKSGWAPEVDDLEGIESNSMQR